MEHMEMKILQPIFGILVVLMKKEITKICNEPGIEEEISIPLLTVHAPL